MKFADLKAHIKKGEFLPCYLAYGDDPDLIKRAYGQFLNTITQFKEFNVSEFDKDADASQITAAAQSLPLMEKYRLVYAPAKSAKDLLGYLKNPNPSTVIFLSADAKDEIKPFKDIELIDCDRLDINLLSAYIASECKKNNCFINNQNASLLVEYCARFMGRISTETEKLIAYRQEGEIDAADIERLVAPALEYKAYELTDSISKKNAVKAMAILSDMLADSQGASKAFGLIYSHFRRLLYAALTPVESELAANFNIKEYAARVAVNQSKAFSKQRLKNMVDRLHEIDYLIKNSSADKISLQSFVLDAVNV